MNKYLCLLLAASITSVMAADRPDETLRPPRNTSRPEIGKRAAGIDQQSCRNALKKVQDAEREKNLSLIAPMFPGVDLQAANLPDETIKNITAFRGEIVKSLKGWQDPEILKTVQDKYVGLNKEHPLVLFRDEWKIIVSAKEEDRKAPKGGPADNKTLEMMPIYSHDKGFFSQLARVPHLGRSLDAARVLTKASNIVLLRTDCTTINDSGTHGLPAQDWTYQLYELPPIVADFIKKYYHIVGSKFQSMVLGTFNLKPLTHAEVYRIMGNLSSENDPENEHTSWSSSYSKIFKRLNDSEKNGIVSLQLRWHPNKSSTCNNEYVFENLFQKNVQDAMELFKVEAPEAKTKEASHSAQAKSSKSSKSKEKTSING